jgi:hypothetical protein
MRILFLGNFEVSYSSESHYKKTLELMGHEVITVQEGRMQVSELHSRIGDVSQEPCLQIDYFFWVHTHGWRMPGIEGFLGRCRELKIPTFAYHLDLYLGIQRERELYNDPFFTVDHFFTVDKMMADWLNDNRKQQSAGEYKYAQGHFLPAGVFGPECYMGTPDREKYPHDIVFTGSKTYHPEWPYRPQLIDWLRETYGNRFGHYGGGGLPTLRGDDLNNLYASAKVVIGDTLCKNFKYPFYSSDRLFEVTGRGGFLIYPSIQGLPNYFTGLSEIIFYDFGNFPMLRSLIDYYCVYDGHREMIRRNGHERAKREHTYHHRLDEIFRVLEQEKAIV